MFTQTVNGVKLTIDPKDHYDNDYACMEQCGVLVEWIADSIELSSHSVAESLQHSYPFFHRWMEHDGATIENDLFCHPEDEPLYPYLKVENGPETILIYPHSIVAVTYEGKPLKWARFD